MCVCERDSQAQGGSRTAQDHRGARGRSAPGAGRSTGADLSRVGKVGGIIWASSGCSLPYPGPVVFALHPDVLFVKLLFFFSSETCLTRNAPISLKLHQQRNFLCSSHQVSAKFSQPARSSGGYCCKRTKSDRF